MSFATYPQQMQGFGLQGSGQQSPWMTPQGFGGSGPIVIDPVTAITLQQTAIQLLQQLQQVQQLQQYRQSQQYPQFQQSHQFPLLQQLQQLPQLQQFQPYGSQWQQQPWQGNQSQPGMQPQLVPAI